MNGHPGLSAEYSRRREEVNGRTMTPLALRLRDPEHGASWLLETVGPVAAASLAHALLELLEGVRR